MSFKSELICRINESMRDDLFLVETFELVADLLEKFKGELNRYTKEGLLEVVFRKQGDTAF